jgi:hypothetical protein
VGGRCAREVKWYVIQNSVNIMMKCSKVSLEKWDEGDGSFSPAFYIFFLHLAHGPSAVSQGRVIRMVGT